jgi:acetyl-CoA acetyltransferase family protein
MTETYIYDYVRTPFGRFGKGLAATRPDDLGAVVLGEIVRRNPALDVSAIDDVFYGAANQSGEDNRNVARMAALLAGYPTSIPGVTVNRLCGSSMEATIQASRAIAVGDLNVAIAGGAESMSRAPWILLKPQAPYPAGNETLHSSTLGWRMVNKKMDERWTINNGQSAEILAERFEISREAQDAFAARSHERAAASWTTGFFANQIVQVPGSEILMDESIRTDTSAASLAQLAPAFQKEGGTVTAGNSSPLNDGASALLLGNEKANLGDPLARIVARGVAANDPNIFGVAPVEAANQALARAGKTWADVDFVEINEAFSAQALSCVKLWKGLDPEKVNVDGGAIAIGHPLGASGSRIIGQLARRLEANGGGVGVAAICIGVGQGLAVVLER